MTRPGLRLSCVGATLVAGLAGYALNADYIPGISGMWLGRALTLAVAMVLGPWFGAAAAVLGGQPAAANEPALLLLFVIEGVMLGAAIRRFPSPLVGRGLVALLVGLSVVVFPQVHGLPPMTWSGSPVALQRVLVLMLAPLASDFVAVAWAAVQRRLGCGRQPSAGRPLRSVVLHAFILVATLPVLIVSTVSGELFAATQQAEVNARLEATALSLADRLNAFIDNHAAGVAAMATALDGHAAPEPRVQALQRLSAVYPAFSALALADRTGLVIHVHPTSRARPGLSVASQPFFTATLRERRVAISDITRSPVNGDPLVFIGAPVLAADGEVTGVAHASLRFAAFDDFVALHIQPSSQIVILDGANRVIFASRGLDLTGGEDLTNAPIVRSADESANASLYSYRTTANEQAYLASRSIVPTTGWTVYVAQPEVLIASEVPAYFLVTLGLACAALLGSAVGARRFAAELTAPLEQLANFVARLSPGSEDTAATPADAPVEIAMLSDGVNQMQRRLRESYALLEGALDDRAAANVRLGQQASRLEDEVSERTAELTRTTRFLENVLTALPGALFVAESDGRIRLCNDAAATLVGRPVHELTGSPMGEVLEPVENATTDESDGVTRGERTLVTATGERVPVFVSSAAFDGAMAPTEGGIHVAIDIRDRKQRELELHQAQKLESVGRLAAGVAHEINTPTQFVSDSVQFLKDGLTDLFGLVSKYRALHQAVLNGRPTVDAAADIAQAEESADLEYLIENVPSAIQRSIDGLGRVTDIVRSMKEFAHPDQKEMGPVDLNRGIQSTLIVARNEYKYIADVETDFGDLPPVMCHGGDINQVVLNIVVNAAHAIGDLLGSTNERGRITIQTRQEDTHAVIHISDTGGGIPEAIRNRVFDPFFTTKGVGRGTGQGLAIARNIVVDKHAGQFTFVSTMGLGTTFTISLPIHGPKATQEAAA